jgi:NitT/TauT family transport system ATP-binding protein
MMSTVSSVGVPAKVTGLRLELDQVRLDYGGDPVVDGLDLTVEPSEILVLTGPSGCGKSTVLRAIAGLLPVTGGQVLADSEPVRKTSRDRAMVFQDDALHPWRTVRGNIMLALTLRGVPRRERKAQAARWMDEIGLAGFADYLPKSLSGGMRQRVQLARGLAGAPRAVLMDEPFGALDAQTRSTMQALLIDTLAAHPATVVFVTHDVDEALLLGDRVVVFGRAGQPIRDVVEVPRPRDPDRHDATDTARLRARITAALEN